MAHYKRGRPRISATHHAARHSKYARTNYWDWLGHWPRWHDIVFHTRPQRRRARAVAIRVLKGADPDAIVWPVSKRPHVYYW